MKIIVVSDSHGDRDLLNKILIKYYDADYFFHLGDSELSPEMLKGFTSVQGNCDYFEFPKELDIDLPFGKVHMEHGNSYNFRNESNIINKGYKLYLYGHTHVKSIKKVGDCYVCNPGSLTYPRDDGIGSFLLIEYKNNEFTFKNIYVDSLY